MQKEYFIFSTSSGVLPSFQIMVDSEPLNHINHGIHYKFKNVRMRKNIRSYHSNQVAWQSSANKDGSFIRTSDIITHS